MQLIAGSKSKRGALDCKYGGLREQEPAQPVAEGVQGEADDGYADASTEEWKPSPFGIVDPQARSSVWRPVTGAQIARAVLCSERLA